MKMNMEEKGRFVLGGVILGLILILVGNKTVSIIGLVMAFVSMGLQHVWFRCPHCGIFIQLWFYKEQVECPQCGKRLGD